MHELAQRLFALSPDIRYVAIYQDGRLHSASRPGLADASSAESDKYEELLVNPTLLVLLRQRGNIDCGGLDHVLIRYGHFFELVAPLDGGHLSVGLEASADPHPLVRRVLSTRGASPGSLG